MMCEPTITDWCCPTNCAPALTDTEKQEALNKAQETIGHLIGSQYVRCETHVWRPCWSCSCVSCCTCTPSFELTVPYKQLASEQIVAVWDDGTRVASGLWRTQHNGNHTMISPVDIGSGLWAPSTRQNLDKYHTLPGTWGIEIETAWVPPLVHQLILGLACEIAQFCRTGTCDLPAGAVSISENGVTVNLDRSMLFSDSRVPIIAELSSIAALYGPGLAVVAGLDDMVQHGVWDPIIAP